MASFHDLLVWQKAMDLVVAVYALCKQMPNDERYGLIDQMQRAVVSIPSNIAEGQSRASRKEFTHFLTIASGSLSELETQVLIAQRLNFVTTTSGQPILQQITAIRICLNALLKSLRTLPPRN